MSTDGTIKQNNLKTSNVINQVGVKQPLEGIRLFSAKKHSDERGFFTETFNKGSLHLPSEFKNNVNQINASFSKKGTIRGMHLQYSPRMIKFITVLKGKVKFVELDVRPRSETYGKATFVLLDEKSQYGLYVPFGFANGFQALEDSIISYACTGFYNSKAEITINPFSEEVKGFWDPVYTLGIIKVPRIISQKDTSALHFSQLHQTFTKRII
jgi:dTDP-4-dehydrorhamnose 3,5-epimerase